MNATELEKLSENEMSQTRGGGQWVWIEEQKRWIWMTSYDLGGKDTPPPPPPPNP